MSSRESQRSVSPQATDWAEWQMQSQVILDIPQEDEAINPEVPEEPKVPVPVAIKAFADSRGFNISHHNGQRIFWPRLELWNPANGSEVFVARLPRDCYEPELVPLMERIGPIFKLRLMMNFSGSNRGYCFVRYFTPELADRAVKLLHRTFIRPGRRIVVMKSVDNAKLLLRGVPTYKTAKEIFDEVQVISEGVQHIELDWPDVPGQPATTGAVYVYYDSHRAAALARSKMLRMNFQLWGYNIITNWADPEMKIPKLVRTPRYSAQRRLAIKM